MIANPEKYAKLAVRGALRRMGVPADLLRVKHPLVDGLVAARAKMREVNSEILKKPKGKSR